MRTLTAVDAVAPAIQRTRTFLFRPFEWGPFLKLSLVALVTEGVGNNFRSSSQGNHPSGHGPMLYSLKPELVAAGIAAVLLTLIILGFIVYLITRLRFAFFHCLIHNTKEIRPGWRLYQEQATRFFWLNVVVALCFLVIMAVALAPFAAGIWRVMRETPPGGPPNVGLILPLVLPLIPVFLLLVVAGVTADLILRDFMLPHYALDDATAGEAWAEVWSSITTEKGPFFAYALLRVILPILATIALFWILLIPGIMVVGAVAMIEFGIHSAFAQSTGSSAVTGVVLQAFIIVVSAGIGLVLSVCVGGPLSTGVREYALLFYGDRYPALGAILFPPALPPTAGLERPNTA